ncbi:MAG: glycoside hydrolase family protein [Planctomycetota bacterium]|jgi:hypothetical protein
MAKLINLRLVSILMLSVLFLVLTGCSTELFESNQKKAFIEKLQPAPVNGGFSMEGYWVWGASVIEGEDGLYHMFASRWPKAVPFHRNWVTNSEIVHAVSQKPEGPYQFKGVVFEKRGREYWDGLMTHNPTIHKYKDTYLLYYIGTRYNFSVPIEGFQPTNEQFNEARANQRIGLATSKSLWGPWERKDKPILEPRPGKWDSLITVNPGVCVKEDGGILLVYKSTQYQKGLLKLGMAGAKHFNGPYYRLSDEPIFQFGKKYETKDDWKKGKHVEDPYIWWNGKFFELVMKDMNGNVCGEAGGGIHATSKDGIKWVISKPPKAYSRTVKWSDGTVTTQAGFERPQVLVQNGKPTHLFAATGTGEKYWRFDTTWNMVIPLK